MNKGKKIAFFGLKGMPPRFGGLQFDAADIGSYLANEGYEIIVYCRKWYQNNYKRLEFKGMQLKVINTPRYPKILDIFIHNIWSLFSAKKNKIDIGYFFSSSSYFFIPLAKFFRIRTIIRRNGFAQTTLSYNSLYRKLFTFSEILGIYLSDVVTVETKPEKDNAEKFTNKNIYITPVGIIKKEKKTPILIKNKYNLYGNDYILFIGRFVKVKRIEWLIKSFEEILLEKDYKVKLVLAGDSDDKSYIKKLKSICNFYNNKSIIFTGYVNGLLKEELISNCLCMVLPSASEGMSTGVMETLSYGGVCLLSDIPSHKWIINSHKDGVLFDNKSNHDLTIKLKSILSNELHLDRNLIQNNATQRFGKYKILNQIKKIIENPT